MAPRLTVSLAGRWGNTALQLPAGAWRDALSGAAVDGGARSVAELLGRFPVALFERVD